MNCRAFFIISHFNRIQKKSNNPLKIKKVHIQDINTLKEISELTFMETFSSENSEENMKEYIKNGFSLNKLESEINNPLSEFYFADIKDKTIGYLKINFGQSQTEIKDNHALEIERIYVLKEYYGKGVGQMLYEKAIALAKEKKLKYVWLGVWEQNSRAIRFYEKNGLIAFNKHVFKLGNDEQIDIMMKLSLK